MEVAIYLFFGSLLLFILAIVLVVAQYRESLPIPQERILERTEPGGHRIERRNDPRYRTSLRIKYKVSEEEGVSWVKDISRGGLRFFLLNPFEVGTFLDIEITLPYDPQPIFTRGRVVWTKRRRNDAGIIFHDVTQEDINRIFQYIGHREEMASLAK